MVKILSDIQFSGSRGNITFGHNKGGQYQRARAVPTNPNSARQQVTRTILANFAAAWAALDAGDQALWRSYASSHPVKDTLGQDIFLSGFNWFVRTNAVLADAGLTQVSVPPVLSAPVGFSTFAATIATSTTASIAFTPVLPSGHAIQLWQTIPGSPGASPNFAQARLVGYSAADETTPWSATLAYEAQSGTLVRFFGKVLSPEGLLSAAFESTAIAP